MIDQELIEQCRAGNFNNFRKLVEMTSPFVYSVAFRILGDEEQAKDAVQETMITIWQKLGKIKSAAVYKTWAYRIVVNKCYDHLRKKKRTPEYIADEKTWTIISDTLTHDQSTALETNELSMILLWITGRLSSKQRTVFVLSELEGMSHDEISEITGFGKTSVKANLYHARKIISERIEKYL